MSESVANLKALLQSLQVLATWPCVWNEEELFSNMPCSRHPASLSGVHCMSQFHQAFTHFGAARDKSQVDCVAK